MSVLTTSTNVTYTSTGSVGPYGFNFSVSTPAALTVIVNNVTLLSTAYTTTPVNNNYDNGGSVTLNNAPPAGQTVVIQRATPLTQVSVFYDNVPQPMAQFENALDKLTQIIQEIAANQSGGSGVKTIVTAGAGILVTGAGTLSNPYVVSLYVTLAITSFTGGLSAELGQSIVNPVFGAAYSNAPTSANITNTDAINSPFVLTTPFTAATIVGTFTHSVTATTTFILTATDGVTTPTSTQTITWRVRIFGGVGATGATSNVLANGTNAVLSNSSVMSSVQLGPEVVGTNFGPFTPAAQSIYLLLTASAHTFTDDATRGGTGFPIPFNAPLTVTFVNQYSQTMTLYLYSSTNTLTGTFYPKVLT